MSKEQSFAEFRRGYKPKTPPLFAHIAHLIASKQDGENKPASDISDRFNHSKGLPLVALSKGEKPHAGALKVGVVFSGGQAPGGHNVIAGLFDSIKMLNSNSEVFGFLKGPKGILEGQYQQLTDKVIDAYRNQGGFDMIGSGRDKIETGEDLKKAKFSCENLQLDGLVIIGGDDSNTNAAVLAEYFLAQGVKTTVVGVPKTIDGDLQNAYVPISFGFDTATKVYSYLISNIQKDAKSSGKYTHFIKLMGRSASHVALECALKTHPNYTLISEWVSEQKLTLEAIVTKLCDIVEARYKKGKAYGVIVIPEGVIEFIPQMRTLIDEINQLIATINTVIGQSDLANEIAKALTKPSLAAWNLLPKDLQHQLLLDRDPHGNVQVSHIQTEKLFGFAVAKELEKRQEQGSEKVKFSPVYHFLGYEGRSTYPSNFDADYCYSLGFVATTLIKEKASGYMCALQNLHLDVEHWKPLGVPIVQLMQFEKRKGKMKPVIEKALVELQGKPFAAFKKSSPEWELNDDDQLVGPICFEGPKDLTDSVPYIVQLSVEK